MLVKVENALTPKPKERPGSATINTSKRYNSTVRTFNSFTKCVAARG